MTAADERFSLGGYNALIVLLREGGYRFATFADLPGLGESDGRLCLLRHDVDVSFAYALRLAREEAEAGIASTYFLMLRSPAYNLLGRAGVRAVREIAALGHEVALHFDAQHPLVTDDSLADLVAEEARILGDLAGRAVGAVSFHQPSARILGADLIIPGFVNTYSPTQMAGWRYVSDSNRNWRGPSAWDLVRSGEHPRIQLLTHPMWWVSDAPATEDAWDEAIADNFRVMQEQFLETEAAYGERRTFEVKRPA